ncbi:unnamed protein product [Polarella glacialis]|uniref:PPM-type phosphatase domain-containing protein n=1 Tax=Polarella glacialis TaxID=89957 RepID=A0A813GX15_POLGL|nr:unnamed protein product [Polarella glacialis]
MTRRYPLGIVAGGLQDGVLSLWDPSKIINSRGADQGLIHSSQVHKGTVNCVEFHPLKSNLMATCGSDSEVNILNIDNPSKPEIYKPSSTNKHQGSEVLACAWNRIVPHILCSCSNTGTTVVWDLKQKKEVISFQDPANRLRCSSIAWHPEVPTQLMVCYDDDRQPSMQMWDLRNCQYPFKETAPHSKGVLGVAWNSMDPNLILSCGKDNRIICSSIATGSPETWCDIACPQWNFEVKWAPHKPSLISASSYNGSVSIYSVQNQQNGAKYCPRWYRKPCGNSFGFGGKMMSFGNKAVAAATADAPNAPKQSPTSSFCQSLVIPTEPDIVPSADMFEQWIAERKLREHHHRMFEATVMMIGCASSNGVDVNVEKSKQRRLSVGIVDKDKDTEVKGSKPNMGALQGLLAEDLLKLVASHQSSMPQVAVGRRHSLCSVTDDGKISFANKSVKLLGDELDPAQQGIGFTCRKGFKPESPNQDSWSLLKVENLFSIYGVYDGHGQKGHDVSEFVRENLPKLILRDERFKTGDMHSLLKDSFWKIQDIIGFMDEQQTLSAQMSGTTATVAVHDHIQSKLFLAHVADSTAVLGKFEDASRKKIQAIQLTRDHKPNLKDEKARIEKAGGRVVFDGYANHRVYAKNGRYPGLNMSRCLGDLLGHAEAGCSCDPEIKEVDLGPLDHPNSKTEQVAAATRQRSVMGRSQDYKSGQTATWTGYAGPLPRWELMGSQFEDEGRTKVPALLGFDQAQIEMEAERYLGKKPGSTLMAPQSQEEEQAVVASQPVQLAPMLDVMQAESFFEELSATTEQKKVEELEREERQQQEAQGLLLAKAENDSRLTDWSAGPEALIKQNLLVGNLTAAVECCFKSGKMAEALLLASGGGTTLWTRAREEYLKLQGDAFLSTVGNIMTNDFAKIVATSNLANWMETLAILATYSGNEYQGLCEQLAERLEKEKFDIRSAVICYICAKNFPKTVTIWANTHVSSQGSQKLALQDLVEKMAVLQEATKFSQADTLFNAKLTQYAEILANSGRLTAAMRYLCLLSDDNGSAILRDRIYHSAPSQMSQMVRSAPRFPFETADVRIVYQPPAAQYQQPHAGMGGAMPGGKMPMQGMGGQGMGGQGSDKRSRIGTEQQYVPWLREVQVVPTWAHGLGPAPNSSKNHEGSVMTCDDVDESGTFCSLQRLSPARTPQVVMARSMQQDRRGKTGTETDIQTRLWRWTSLPPSRLTQIELFIRSPDVPVELAICSCAAGGMGPGGMGQGGMGAGGMGGGMGAGGGMGYGGMAAPAPAPSAPVANPGPGMGPAPRVNVNAGMPPAPNVGGMGGGMGGMGAPAGGMGGGAPQMGMGGNTGMGGGGMGGYSHTGAATPVGYHQQGAMGMGASPHSSQHGSGFGMPPARSGGGTAPTASAMPVVDGLPVCWPLPTKAMQRLSTNQSVAGANMAIQELSSGGAYVIGEPMAAHDLAQVRNVFTMLLDSSSQDGNVKKREDISKRMDELYAKLQCSPEPSAMQYCSATFCGLCPWIGFLLATVVVRYTMSCPRHHTFSMTLPRCYCALGLSVANN